MRGHAMSKAALVLLDQMTTEIDTLLRVKKKESASVQSVVDELLRLLLLTIPLPVVGES